MNYPYTPKELPILYVMGRCRIRVESRELVVGYR
jgi:hypothetical protein